MDSSRECRQNNFPVNTLVHITGPLIISSKDDVIGEMLDWKDKVGIVIGHNSLYTDSVKVRLDASYNIPSYINFWFKLHHLTPVSEEEYNLLAIEARLLDE